jgi:hypothetical protein
LKLRSLIILNNLLSAKSHVSVLKSINDSHSTLVGEVIEGRILAEVIVSMEDVVEGAIGAV